jgi:signal transduction histidine kinase
VLRDPETAPSALEVDTLLGTIERNADRMQRVVGDILEIARFRTGEVVLQLRRFDASAMARGAVASVEPLAAQRDQAIKVDVPSAPVRAFGDHRRLEQALVNLISNAVKYGPEGGTITVRVRSVGTSVAWTVTDQGPGIPVNEQPHLFERFFVGQNDRKGSGRGVGLGLPTALAIAQAHGGGIDVTSVPGYGSVFSIVVPVEGPPDTD